MKSKEIIIRNSEMQLYGGIFCILVVGAILILMLLFPNDTATFWVFGFTILVFLANVYFLITSFTWKVVIKGTEICYRNSFGKTKVVSIQDVKAIKYHGHPRAPEVVYQIVLCDGAEKIFSVEPSKRGAEAFLNWLDETSIESELRNGFKKSLKQDGVCDENL